MKYLTLIVAIAAATSLAACTTASLEASDPKVTLVGTLKRNLLERTAEVTYNGKIYRGSWEASAASSDLQAQTTYPHRKHLTNFVINLSAEDGTEIRCTGLTHSMEGELACNVGNQVVMVGLD